MLRAPSLPCSSAKVPCQGLLSAKKKHIGSLPSEWRGHVPGCTGQDPEDKMEKHC